MRPENFDVQELIKDLNGTCMTIDNFLPEGMDFVDLTEADHVSIDLEIFKCDECDWWCECCDSNAEGICIDCRPDQDED